MAEAPTVVSKLSVKTLGCDPKECIVQKKAVPLARFWGLAETVKYVVNRQTGDTNIALIGQFRGMNLQDGEVFESGVMYLPSGLHDQLSGPLIKDMEAHSLPPIKFGIEVSATPAANPIGYSYQGKNFVKAEGHDPFAEIEEVMKGLTQPKKVAKSKEK